MSKNKYLVCRDRNGRTCIQISFGDLVEYIPMATGEGFQIEETSATSFNQRYKPLPKYPVNRACQLFLNYSTILGASEEVLDYLSKEVTVTKEDYEMATSKFNNPPPTEMKKPVKKTASKKASVKTTAKKAPAKKTPAKKSTAKKTQATGDYKSAAAMFQGLIMASKLTDDEIFAEVQEQFGLDDKKRSYVSWYRNKLKKDGQNPPEAK